MAPTTAEKPNVLLVSLDRSAPFEQVHHQLLSKLQSMSALDRATTPASAIKALTDAAPHAVLVTDGGIAQHRDVYAKLLDYARSGGILVLMGTFSSFTRPSDFQSLFQKAGLPWKAGDYHRTTVYRNDTDATSSRAELPASYSQKAVFLTGVPRKYAWYLPNASSRTESHVFPSEPIADQSQTPVAFADLGAGKLGYVGDVNGEEGSEAVVLAMCGLGGGA